MDQETIYMHYRAARKYGQELSCGTKVDHMEEARADKAAISLSNKRNKEFEAYPCWWCGGWHIGRKMTQEEVDIFKEESNES